MRLFTVVAAGMLAVLFATPLVAGAQSRDAPIPYDVGQSASPSFEGWYPNEDGTFSLSFGYFNRNYEQTLDIPIGPDNHFTPGPEDRGQPTHLLPRRHTGMFTVVVPADFGDRTLTWSLTAAGETFAVPGPPASPSGGSTRWRRSPAETVRRSSPSTSRKAGPASARAPAAYGGR